MVDQTEVQLILVEHSPGFDITNNFSQPGAGNAFIRQPKDE